MTFTRVTRLREQIDDNARHTCIKAMSSLCCYACQMGVPYHHLAWDACEARFGRARKKGDVATNFQTAARSARLIPPDMRQCQAESKEPHQPFRIGFPEPRFVRCKAKPRMVAMEPRNNGKADRGAMSLCLACSVVFQELYAVENGNPDKAQLEDIAAFAAAHKLGGDDALWPLIEEHP